MYDYFNLVQLYEKSKKENNKLKCKNYDLEKENKQLKDNWNKLKEYLSFDYIDKNDRDLVFSELDKNFNLLGNKIDELIYKVNEMESDK